MYRRVNMQPDPMKDYFLESADGLLYFGRWLVGNTFEGWYIPKTRVIIPQKKAKIMFFYEKDSPKRQYFPKSFLDEIFNGSQETRNVSLNKI